MKQPRFIAFLAFLLLTYTSTGQSCTEVMEYVKSKSHGTTYSSINSEAISRVTFHKLYNDYQYYYFAIVCFKSDYFGCTEYIYQVSSSTESYYSTYYLTSAGKAFWKYIQPHNNNLGCAPN